VNKSLVFLDQIFARVVDSANEILGTKEVLEKIMATLVEVKQELAQLKAAQENYQVKVESRASQELDELVNEIKELRAALEAKNG